MSAFRGRQCPSLARHSRYFLEGPGVRIGRSLPAGSRSRVGGVEDIPVGQISRVTLTHCHARSYGYAVLRTDGENGACIGRPDW